MTASLNLARALELAQSSRCILRRRQSRVVVRAPDAPPGTFPKIGQERRARISTLIGIGAREAMPTLFDFDDFDDEPTCPRASSVNVTPNLDEETSIALADWHDDEDETCFDV